MRYTYTFFIVYLKLQFNWPSYIFAGFSNFKACTSKFPMEVLSPSPTQTLYHEHEPGSTVNFPYFYIVIWKYQGWGSREQRALCRAFTICLTPDLTQECGQGLKGRETEVSKFTQCQRSVVSQKAIHSLILNFPSTTVLVWVEERLKVLAHVKSLTPR